MQFDLQSFETFESFNNFDIQPNLNKKKFQNIEIKNFKLEFYKVFRVRVRVWVRQPEPELET